MKYVTGIKSVNEIPQPELSAVISAVMTTDGMRPDWIARLREERERHDHRDVDALDNCADRLGPGWPTRLQTYTTTTSFIQVKITLKMQKNILFN